MNLNDFDEPFVAEDIEWRVQQCGKTGQGKIWAMVLAYVTNRAIMKRLDDVCGKAGWRNEYRDIPNNGGVECGISIKVDGEWITKWDAAENTQVEAVKGGRSGAMKRAAVQWGIGRYLYNLEEGFAQISDKRLDGWNRGKTKGGDNFYWAPPAMPAWALPKQKSAEKAMEEPNQEQQKTPFDILKEFSAAAEQSTDAKHLQQLFGPVWKALSGTEEQAKAKEVYDIRKSELEGK